MKKGTPIKEVLCTMKARGVVWPITRALAVRYHWLPSDVVRELMRRGLVVEGSVPAEHLPPPTNDAALDLFIRDVTELGVRWPATRDVVRGYGAWRNNGKLLTQLREHGLIRGPELDDPLLTPALVSVLEWMGIESKEEFRDRMAAGELKLQGVRRVGQQGVEKLMAWAYGNEAQTPRVGLNLRVSPETKEGLEILRIRLGLTDSEAVVESLVNEALREERKKDGRGFAGS